MGDPGVKAMLDETASFMAFAIWAADRKWGQVPQRKA
jgi:oligopeptidase B